MTWQNLTQEEQNTLIHEKVMGKSLHTPCLRGQIDEYMGSYWTCTCGWVSPFFIDENKSTEHEVPIPNYVGDWNAAWQVLQYMVKAYCVQDVWGTYGEVWHRFTSKLNQVHPLEPNIYPWIALWTPEILSRASYYGVTGEEA